MSNLTISFKESSNLCILGISSFLVLIFGSYPWEDLELVLFSMTSSSSSKTDSICILYCVFDIGVFTGLSFLDRSNLCIINIILFGSYPCEDFELVSISMTSSSSSKTDFICILYDVFDVGVFIGSSRREVSPLYTLYFLPCWSSIFSLFVGHYVSLSFQQNWFHPIWSSVLKLSQFSFRVPQAVVPLTQAVVPLEVQKKHHAEVPGRYRSGTGSHAVCPAGSERYQGGSTA